MAMRSGGYRLPGANSPSSTRPTTKNSHNTNGRHSEMGHDFTHAEKNGADLRKSIRWYGCTDSFCRHRMDFLWTTKTATASTTAGPICASRQSHRTGATVGRPEVKRARGTKAYAGVRTKTAGRAAIHHNNKYIWLGYFDNEKDAARAYDKAAIRYHREFAALNFPPGHN